MIVHANGVVSQQYLENCRKGKADVDPELKLGDRLFIDRRYLKRTAEVFFEFGIELGHVVWRKVLGSKTNPQPERSYSNVCFDLIKAKRYGLANKMLQFGVSMPNLPEDYLRIMTVNYANSLKLNGEGERSEEVLKSLDWSASALEYKVSIAAIRGDTNEVVRLMQVIGTNGTPSKNDYVTWPVFLNVRAQRAFRAKYAELFNVDFVEEELSADKSSQSSDPTETVAADDLDGKEDDRVKPAHEEKS